MSSRESGDWIGDGCLYPTAFMEHILLIPEWQIRSASESARTIARRTYGEYTTAQKGKPK
jgi:hypothetical protein